MKRTIFIFLAAVIGVAVVWAVVSRQNAETLRRQQELWKNERAALEAALEAAKGQETIVSSGIEKAEIIRVREETSPREIIARLQKIKIVSGPAQTRNTRLAIQQFENLIASGPAALPEIREFLLRNEEIDYESSVSPRASREGKMNTDFVLPPSLRFGMFDATKQIGGIEAEEILAEILSITGRGAEVAYLARVLQDMAPFKYRDTAVNAAREMLAQAAASTGPGLDKYDREYLYGVLSLYGDASFAAEAQAQLLRTDGSIDRGALKYLQSTMGVQALSAITQAYQSPTLDPDKREPLIRYALTYAGADALATDFWHKGITDPKTPGDVRRELIEDLNQDGIQNESHPTVADAKLIAERLKLIARLYGEVDDPGIKDAWREAGKDLLHMGQEFLGMPETPYTLGQDTKELENALLNAPSRASR